MLRGVWQALNCLSIHATYCVIVAGASPGATKMWAVVRENGDFFTFVDHVKTNKHNMLEFFSPSGSHTILVYRSYTDTKHRAASLRQQSFLQGRFYVGAGGHRPPKCWPAPLPQIFWFQQQKYALLNPGYFCTVAKSTLVSISA